MTSPPQQPESTDARENPDWFREPTAREHWIGAALFVGFGIFFILLFIVLRGWWFRWVILGLGAWSILAGLRHAMDAMRGRS